MRTYQCFRYVGRVLLSRYAAHIETLCRGIVGEIGNTDIALSYLRIDDSVMRNGRHERALRVIQIGKIPLLNPRAAQGRLIKHQHLPLLVEAHQRGHTRTPIDRSRPLHAFVFLLFLFLLAAPRSRGNIFFSPPLFYSVFILSRNDGIVNEKYRPKSTLSER